MSGTNCYPPNGVCRPNWDWPVCGNGIPKLRTWGLSATLGNLDIAQSALLGTEREGVLIDGDLKKKFEVEVLIPKDMEKFPLGGTSRGQDGEGSGGTN